MDTDLTKASASELIQNWEEEKKAMKDDEEKSLGVPSDEAGNIKLNGTHTPGPWSVVPEADSGYATPIAESHWQIEQKDGMTLAVTVGDLVPEEAANARLIAAAPALYAALKEALNVMSIQEQREAGAFHLSASAFRPMWDRAGLTGYAALALVEEKQ